MIENDAKGGGLPPQASSIAEDEERPMPKGKKTWPPERLKGLAFMSRSAVAPEG